MGARSVLLAGADERDLTKLAEYRAIGGYARCPKARALTPDALIEELLAVEPARPRRRRLPDGPQGLADRPQEREAQVPRRQRRRVGAGRVQGPRGDGARAAPADRGLPDRRARDRVQGRLHLHPRRVPRPSTRSSSARSTRPATAGLFGDVEITVYRGAGAYICGEETALLDSLEGRRGQPRPRPPFPPVQGLYSAPTQINNVCTIATVPAIIELGAAEFAKIGVESSPGTAIFSISGQRRAARQLRARARDADARADLRLRRRDPRRARAEGRDPGRLVGAGALARPDRRAARLRLAGRARHVLRRRLADRRRRPLLHGAARAPLDQVLHARVVRQVHAVPRGDALDGADPRAARGRPRRRSTTSTCCGRSARGSSASRCARSATSPCTRSRATSRSGARSSTPTSSSARCPFDGESSLEGIVAPERRARTRTTRVSA